MLEHLDTMIGFAVVMLLLSLLITVIVQLVLNVFNLRAHNLVIGIRRTLELVDPALLPHAEAIAEKVLEHGAVSPGGWWPKATAIRFEELVTVLGVLATDATWSDTTARTALQTALAKSDRLYPAPSKDDLELLFPGVSDADIEAALARLRARKDGFVDDLKTWYDAVMDRTCERFSRHTKVITGVAALLVSFGLTIDSVAILKQISGDASLRAKLVQSADSAIKMADDYTAKVAENADLATSALEKTRTEMKLAATVAPGLKSRAEGKQWIVANVDADKLAAATATFEKHYNQAALGRVDELTESARTIKAKLDDTQLVLFQMPRWDTYGGHVLGMLISTLLLSLGAPFWYNLLRQLSGLRPHVAGKIDEEKAGEAEG